MRSTTITFIRKLLTQREYLNLYFCFSGNLAFHYLLLWWLPFVSLQKLSKTASCLNRDENARELNYKKNKIHQLFLHSSPLTTMPLRATFRKWSCKWVLFAIIIYRLLKTCFFHCCKINITKRGIIRVISWSYTKKKQEIKSMRILFKEWWWWWIVFVAWLTNERRLALFSPGTIVRNPQHRESSTRREQSLNLRRTWVQA